MARAPPRAALRAVFRPLGVEEQLELPLQRSGTRTVALGFNWERATFTARERQLLEAFRPHVVAAEAFRPHVVAAARAAQQASALHLSVQGLERALEGAGCALLVVDRAGAISAGTDAAWRLLRSCFGVRASAATLLPESLRVCCAPGWTRSRRSMFCLRHRVPSWALSAVARSPFT